MVTLLTQKMEALAFQKAVQEDAPFVKRDFVSQSLTTAQVESNFNFFNSFQTNVKTGGERTTVWTRLNRGPILQIQLKPVILVVLTGQKLCVWSAQKHAELHFVIIECYNNHCQIEST